MITENNKEFRIETKNTSYWLRVTKFGHLESVHYGGKLGEGEMEPLSVKRTSMLGTCTLYSTEDDIYCLDNIPLEWSGIGKGDYREPPCEITMPDDSFICDFVYHSHSIEKGGHSLQGLPSPTDGDQTLTLTLKDRQSEVYLDLFYTVFYDCDTIARSAKLRNRADKPIQVRKLMSYMLDLPNRGYKMVTFNGNWISEANRSDRELSYGSAVLQSRTGFSSNRSNPGFLLAEKTATQENGRVYGFNLIYSGNHYSCCELSSNDLLRITGGINPFCFSWTVNSGDRFETPCAVMSFSDRGYNGLSHGFHRFVNNHIVRGDWKNRERPVLVNDWESYFFKFTAGKLLRLARLGKRLGAELFVLDDGWFKNRDNDRAGLGDYEINRKKLPRGLKGLSKDIKKMGLMFGLWVEPESVNPDSDLYRSHPEYAIAPPTGQPVLGRNQLLLDLTQKQVRDYIVTNVGSVLDSAGVSYVKWDMNRHMSDFYSHALKNQGEFFHRYILGLYSVLDRIFTPRPHILLESCASGGNRFDLGMLCYSPQIWASDDTDPGERLKIQEGLSYLYPQSTVGAHVSSSPHQQTLRSTKLSNRFNLSAFGCLGYELELKYLTHAERKQVKRDIQWYKDHRKLLQFGQFDRIDSHKSNKKQWQVTAPDGAKAVIGFFQTLSRAAEGTDVLRAVSLPEHKKYKVKTKQQTLDIKGFGALVHHILPLRLNPNGFILRTANKLYALEDCVEEYTATGAMLREGLGLNNQFSGSYYNEYVRLLGDFGSSLYTVDEI